MLDVVPTILHVLRRKSNKELVDLQQALPRRNLTAGKVGGGTFTKHHGVQLDRERDWEQWLAGSAPHHVPRGVCCGTRKCGLYMDNGGGGARCSSEARLALPPVRQTCRWSTHSLNRFLPCVTTTPVSHEALSIPVLLLRTVLVVGASRSGSQQCDLGLLELLVRVPNTTVRENTSLVVQSPFMPTPSQVLPALIKQQCLQGEPYHVLQPALCQYIAKQILASYDSGVTPLGHVNNGKNRNDDDTISAFV